MRRFLESGEQDSNTKDSIATRLSNFDDLRKRERSRPIDFARTALMFRATLCTHDPKGFKGVELINLLVSKYNTNPTIPPTGLGYTFLHRTQDPRIVKLLLHYGANPNYHNPGSYLPSSDHIVRYSIKDDPALIRILLEKWANTKLAYKIYSGKGMHNVLEVAFSTGKFNIPCTLLGFRATITHQRSEISETGLYDAIDRRSICSSHDARVECVRRLLESGAPANEYDQTAKPMSYTYRDAAIYFRLDISQGAAISKLLLEHGDDPHVKNLDGEDFLQRSARMRVEACRSSHVMRIAILTNVAI